ncbi:nucleoside diphosphate kinase [Corynebacterium epidermidicanis]|uniref:Nucleoside diphosphate kinase n=2 Tax=Corynebacterium epidermidicanis TaxID=1050174 RepID=A0A0G3GY75_9CORY|nr:nucleoside diphosphate kinase [Corynebacterium epidermidicanis]
MVKIFKERKFPFYLEAKKYCINGGNRACGQTCRTMANMTERTLILIKPDGVANGHVGEIIARIERKGLKLVAMDLRVADKKTAEKHYAEHADKPFFGELVSFITSAPLVAGIVEGERAIDAWRQLAGGTDPVSKATPGTIRGDFALTVGENVVHGSDSPESAEREIGIWFPNL